MWFLTYPGKLEFAEIFRRERIYPFRLGNVFMGCTLNGKKDPVTIQRTIDVD